MQNNKFRVGDRVFLRTARIYADIVDVLDAGASGYKYEISVSDPRIMPIVNEEDLVKVSPLTRYSYF